MELAVVLRCPPHASQCQSRDLWHKPYQIVQSVCVEITFCHDKDTIHSQDVDRTFQPTIIIWTTDFKSGGRTMNTLPVDSDNFTQSNTVYQKSRTYEKVGLLTLAGVLQRE